MQLVKIDLIDDRYFLYGLKVTKKLVGLVFPLKNVAQSL
jgi:hypothetical protein